MGSTVAATECFDLRCTRGNAELHVEVKGTTSPGEQIVLTRNEVDHARQQYPAMALAIIRNIEIKPRDSLIADGGELGVLEPWQIDEDALECLAFSYGYTKTVVQLIDDGHGGLKKVPIESTDFWK